MNSNSTRLAAACVANTPSLSNSLVSMAKKLSHDRIVSRCPRLSAAFAQSRALPRCPVRARLTASACAPNGEQCVSDASCPEAVTDAHETDERLDSTGKRNRESKKDLRNNEAGREIAKRKGNRECYDAALDALSNGQLTVIPELMKEGPK